MQVVRKAVKQFQKYTGVYAPHILETLTLSKTLTLEATNTIYCVGISKSSH